MKTPRTRYIALAGMLLTVGAFSGLAVAQETLSPLSFSAPQVAGGRVTYADKCSKCHGDDLEGGAGPALSEGSLDNYLSGSAGALFEFINASMPQDAPGSLSPDETTSLIAYLASKNGRTPGGAPLPSDMAALGKIGFKQ
ncbi:MAG: hypothetical protein BGN86_01585 [Caulobacterales bacterium 68-7]|nr:MAG: hypothetical protein BGN86_01585 [Caulobacterales bacterium 68-7]